MRFQIDNVIIFMIEKINTNSEKDIIIWYNKYYSEKGTWQTSKKYNNMMLDYLGIKTNNTKKLLDVACGGGYLLEHAEQRCNVHGVEISEIAIKEAKIRSKSSNLYISNAEKLPFKDKIFDYVTCLGSLEHFLNMDAALIEMKRVLKDDGLINIYVPNSYYIYNLYIVYKTGMDPLFEQVNERFATNLEWQNLINKYFDIVSYYGVEPHIIKYEHLLNNISQHNYSEFLMNIIRKFHVPKNFNYCFSYICRKRK